MSDAIHMHTPGEPLKFAGDSNEFGVIAVTPATDPDSDSDSARLTRHRALHQAWYGPKPETHAERRLREALDHLAKVVLAINDHAEQQAADTAAREFLADCGR